MVEHKNTATLYKKKEERERKNMDRFMTGSNIPSALSLSLSLSLPPPPLSQILATLNISQTC